MSNYRAERHARGAERKSEREFYLDTDLRDSAVGDPLIISRTALIPGVKAEELIIPSDNDRRYSCIRLNFVLASARLK